MVTGVDGLVSGIPTGDIIDAMIAADRQVTVLSENKKVRYEAQLEAVQSFNTRLLSAQLDSGVLKRSSLYNQHTASSSDDSVMTATANSNALPGSSQLEVVSIATAHQMATKGQSSQTADMGSGSLSFQLGNGSQTVLNLTNASLNDIATAINDADAGVNASVINDGTGTPYRLVFQSAETGLENELTISGTGSFSSMFDQAGNMDELTEAADASIKLGSGAGAIPITSSDNSIEDVVPGVTLDVKKVGTMTLTVETDVTEAQTAIETFVESVNSAIEYFNDNSKYNAETKEAGILFSETGLRRNVNDLTRTLLDAVPGLPSDSNTLSSIGITVNKDSGLFEIDTGKLTDALADDADSVRQLFSNTGTSSDTGVQFAALSEDTDISSDFTVDITQVAEQAQVATTGNLAASTIITGANNALDINLNGTSYAITLVEGTYSRTDLAEHIGQVINDTVTSGSKVEVNLNGDALDIRSKNYGSNQTIQVTGGSAVSDLAVSLVEATGQNVAGTINGTAATGNGQVLNGVEGEASEGLRLSITSQSLVTGVTVSARKGIAQLAQEAFRGMTDVQTGTVAQKTDNLEDRILDITESIEKKDAALELRRQRYQADFLQMEKLMAQFKTQETFLAGQMTAFQNMAAGNAQRG